MKAKPWKFTVFPVIAISFLAIYPQLSLLLAKNGNWRGSYFSSNYDETAYSAYVNALADGRPRKFDPFLDQPVEFESLYSIQFIPAYSIAVPARLLGISTSTSFIVLILVIAISSALSLFFLIRQITSDDLLAAAGTIAVLCFGTAAAYQGEIRYLIEGRLLVEYLPFLRRYQPGLAFPLFFFFCLLIWRAITAESTWTILKYSVSAGSVFALLVFSYFYIWTASAAWLACLGIIWLLTRGEHRKRLMTAITAVGACGTAALVPYFVLLSERSPNVDSTQLLTLTRTPDLSSPTLFIGLAVASLVFLAAREKLIQICDPLFIFTLSFALTPVILFNQQVVTGKSLQPAHYEIFISNYLVLTGAVLGLAIWMRKFSSESGLPFRRGLIYILLLASGWGLVEAVGSSGRSAAAAVVRDESVPALRYIQQQAGKFSSEPAVIHSTNFVTSDLVPTETYQRPLWNAHINSAGGIDPAENKRLFYLYLYYSGFTEQDLAEFLSRNSFEITAAIFGSDRALPELAKGVKPVTAEQIRNEVRSYADFVRLFDRGQASSPPLSWLIVPTKSDQDLSNLDRWYRRDEETAFGMFKVYRLTLK